MLSHTTNIRQSALVWACAATLSVFSLAANAAETPIGKPHVEGGMEVAAVYLQPIEMDPPGMMRDAAKSDIHLEADIHAVKGNKYGFGEGDWIPYLVVKYELSKEGDKNILKGDFMPMVASDGPHYGDNIKLDAALAQLSQRGLRVELLQ